MLIHDEDGFLSSGNESATRLNRKPILSNHTGCSSKGSEGWEHDDTGNEQNYSGCYDDMMDPIAEHEGWQEGYDY